MSGYSDGQDALFQELEATELKALEADIRRRGFGKPFDIALKMLYKDKRTNAQILESLRAMEKNWRNDSN